VELVEIADDPRAAWLEIEERGWGDGLPCVPPVAALVEDMLAGADPDEIVANLPPSGADATLGLIAVNTVMAGCLSGVLPAVAASVRAAADPRFNLLAVQTTTNPATEVVIVNGPARSSLGLVSGASCLGNGASANRTLGRAVRLSLMNIGGARPGKADRATHGFPGKVSLCFSEAEEASPWEPLHARQLPAEMSAVTVVAGSGTLNLMDMASDAEELLRGMAGALAFSMSNDVVYGGTPVLVIGPDHARVLGEAGLSRKDVQSFLFEHATVRASSLSAENRGFIAGVRSDQYPAIRSDTAIGVTKRPDDILLVVAGAMGPHTVLIPSYGDSRAVTVPIA
jgi:hypothetical protein